VIRGWYRFDSSFLIHSFCLSLWDIETGLTKTDGFDGRVLFLFYLFFQANINIRQVSLLAEVKNRLLWRKFGLVFGHINRSRFFLWLLGGGGE